GYCVAASVLNDTRPATAEQDRARPMPPNLKPWVALPVEWQHEQGLSAPEQIGLLEKAVQRRLLWFSMREPLAWLSLWVLVEILLLPLLILAEGIPGLPQVVLWVNAIISTCLAGAALTATWRLLSRKPDQRELVKAHRVAAPLTTLSER